MSILGSGTRQNSIFEKHWRLYPQGYHHFVSTGFLQRLQALKTPDVIYIHTINHFLNGVSSFQMHCVTPE